MPRQGPYNSSHGSLLHDLANFGIAARGLPRRLQIESRPHIKKALHQQKPVLRWQINKK
jgi:hypothetical protein